MVTTEEVFDDITSNCDVLLSSLCQEKEADTAPTTDLTLDDYHTNLTNLSKLLSHEATKFAIAHSSPPYPEVATSQTLAGGLCNAANQLIGSYLLLPSSAGTTFLNYHAQELRALVESVKNFSEAIKNIVLKNETLQAGLFSTGVLWSFCDRIPLLPKSNTFAVNKILRKEEQLINDAINELDETSADFDLDSSHDSDNDPDVHGIASELIPSVKGLAKTAAALLRKVKKLLDVYASTDYRRLDPVAEVASTLSSTLDDLVCSLYSPVNVAQALSNGILFSSRLQEILTIARDFAGEEDQKWIELIDKGIKHNLQNLQAKTSSA